VLDPSPSNLDTFLSRDTCVSQIQLKRPIWNKMSLLHLENSDLWEVFLSKTNSVLTVIQCAKCPASNTDGFLLGDISVSSTQLTRPI
jgi:hypothetical protein